MEATSIVSHVAAMPDVDRYIGQSRVVLLFASRQDDPALLAQRATLSGDAAVLRERDVVVFTVVGANDTTRRRYQAEMPGFTAVLVGKDGGVKLRSRHPLALASLIATIDAMPMRRSEMGRRSP
jgi:hypothetical protein